MFRWTASISLTAMAGLAVACGGPTSGRGFSLPTGDVAAGEATFTEIGCLSCHTIQGREDLREQFEAAEMTIPLGGKVTRISTHGELVTSIINPSHRISNRHLGDIVNADGSSRMVAINDVMTVNQLVDLVAYLQSQYELESYRPTTYPPYTY